MNGQPPNARYVIGIDQGTTSSRAVIFDAAGTPVSTVQREHSQILPRPGWVEHDPHEIWCNMRAVIEDSLAAVSLASSDIAALGITNQRETTLVWNRHSGEPVYNAIVWQDTRTQPMVDELARHGGLNRFAEQTGLPLASYFSATKIAWILDNVEGARAGAERGELVFGTMDSWLLWKLTGGVSGGIHLTDVTNASRTLLMGLRTLEWDEQIAAEFGIPMRMLPRIASSSEVYGVVARGEPLAGVPIAGILGDQQSAAFGQAAFSRGEAKNTYGTGNFLIVNTGAEIVRSDNGLITTLAYRIGSNEPRYALEGSVAVTGSLIHWLRDNLGVIDSDAEIEALAREVDDNGGVYVVPAFSGLFAPHWRPDARGAVLGLTHFVTKAHLARAALEAIAFQTSEVVEAMNADIGIPLAELRVDGGATVNGLLLQLQADILGVPVVRPRVIETTALGAASAAGLAVGFWSGFDELRANWREDRRWSPSLQEDQRLRLQRNWSKAVKRTLNWVDEDVRG